MGFIGFIITRTKNDEKRKKRLFERMFLFYTKLFARQQDFLTNSASFYRFFEEDML